MEIQKTKQNVSAYYDADGERAENGKILRIHIWRAKI